MNLEVTITRGELGVTKYNDEMMKVLEGPLDAGKGEAFTAWQRFRSARKIMVEAIESLTGSTDPFTLTLRVEGKKKVYPPGPMLYSAGSGDDRQVESQPAETGEAPQA